MSNCVCICISAYIRMHLNVKAETITSGVLGLCLFTGLHCMLSVLTKHLTMRVYVRHSGMK